MSYLVAKFTKKTDGRVDLLNASDIPLATLSENSQIRRNKSKDGFIIRDNATDAVVVVYTSKLVGYTIEPGAFVPFVGSMFDWWIVLNEKLFPINYPVAHTDEIVDGSNYAAGSLTAALNSILLASGGGIFTGLMALENVLDLIISDAITNDFAPTGLSTANLLLINAVGNNRQIRGISAHPTNNQILFVVVVDGNSVRFIDDSVTSIAENRLKIGGNKTLTLGGSIILCYSQTQQRWLCLARSN